MVILANLTIQYTIAAHWMTMTQFVTVSMLVKLNDIWRKQKWKKIVIFRRTFLYYKLNFITWISERIVTKNFTVEFQQSLLSPSLVQPWFKHSHKHCKHNMILCITNYTVGHSKGRKPTPQFNSSFTHFKVQLLQ